MLLVVAAASLFGWVLTTTQLTEGRGGRGVSSVTDNRYVILLLINVLLLVVGCFLETIASISILSRC